MMVPRAASPNRDICLSHSATVTFGAMHERLRAAWHSGLPRGCRERLVLAAGAHVVLLAKNLLANRLTAGGED